MLIGRNKELEFLNKKYNKKNAEFIFLYGRKRLGKSAILQEFARDKSALFYTCSEVTNLEQLRTFNTTYSNTFKSSKNHIGKFSDWDEIFKSFSKIKIDNNERILIIINEFQYMIKEDRSIASIIQKYWDHYFSKMNIMIVLCGSDIPFIKNEVLSYKNPLYGRASGIYKIEEMDFYDSTLFFPGFSAIEKIQAYSILGGTPFYLKIFKDKLTIKENVITNILEDTGILKDEVTNILNAEFSKISTYNTIIRAIAKGEITLNEIAENTSIDKTSSASVYLNTLIDLEIAKKEFSINPYTNKVIKKDTGYYKLNNNYFRFYNQYVAPNIDALVPHNTSEFYDQFIELNLDKYISCIFKEICMNFITKLNYNNELPDQFDKIGKYFEKPAISNISSIDFIAINKKAILLGACKFSNTPFSLNEYKKIINNQNLTNDYEFAYFCLFSKSGFDKSLINLEKEDPYLLLFDLEKIVNYKFEENV